MPNVHTDGDCALTLGFCLMNLYFFFQSSTSAKGTWVVASKHCGEGEGSGEEGGGGGVVCLLLFFRKLDS